jgi:general stress protein 26
MDKPIRDEETLQALLKLLAEAQTSWFSSVRPDGRPHSLPVWHVLGRGHLYLAVQAHSVKAANVRSNPRVALGARLEDPLAGLIVEGMGRLRPELRAEVSPLFVAKYEWDIKDDEDYSALIEIEPERLMAWGKYGEGRWSGEEIRRAMGAQG